MSTSAFGGFVLNQSNECVVGDLGGADISANYIRLIMANGRYRMVALKKGYVSAYIDGTKTVDNQLVNPLDAFIDITITTLDRKRAYIGQFLKEA